MNLNRRQFAFKTLGAAGLTLVPLIAKAPPPNNGGVHIFTAGNPPPPQLPYVQTIATWSGAQYSNGAYPTPTDVAAADINNVKTAMVNCPAQGYLTVSPIGTPPPTALDLQAIQQYVTVNYSSWGYNQPPPGPPQPQFWAQVVLIVIFVIVMGVLVYIILKAIKNLPAPPPPDPG